MNKFKRKLVGGLIETSEGYYPWFGALHFRIPMTRSMAENYLRSTVESNIAQFDEKDEVSFERKDYLLEN